MQYLVVGRPSQKGQAAFPKSSLSRSPLIVRTRRMVCYLAVSRSPNSSRLCPGLLCRLGRFVLKAN